MHLVLVNPRAAPVHRRLPLSLLHLARVIPAPHQVEIVDANVMPDAVARVEAAVAAGAAAVLFTVMPGPQLREVVPWSRSLKARFPRLLILWGGYFPTVHPGPCARDPGVDLVVMGPGEEVLPALLPAIEAGALPAGLPGTAVWREGRLVQGPPAPVRISASYGPLDYGLVDMGRYGPATYLGRRTFNLHSSLGCPFTCNFCAVTSMFEGRWLADRPPAVIAAVETLHRRYGADAVEFHDNNFFAAEGRTLEIAAGIAPFGLSWWGEGRIDTMERWSDASWARLAASGLRMAFYGAESGDDRVLDAMNKGGLRVEQTRALNRRAAQHGIIPEFSFVLGNPMDPGGDIEQTLSFVEGLKADNPACEIILYLYSPVPLPGMLDGDSAAGFAFPETLDDWLSPRWSHFDQRRNPQTPWITPAMVDRVFDFEAVLHARWPSVADRRLQSWQRRILGVLAGPRMRLRRYGRPYGIKALQRAWGYRRPDEAGL